MGIPTKPSAAPQAADNMRWGDRRDALPGWRSFGSPRRRAFWFGALFVGASLLFLSGWRLGRGESQTGTGVTQATTGVHSVLPGEFQPCGGLLVAPPPEWASSRLDVLVEVIAQARHYLQVYVLVRDEAHRQAWIDQMRRGNLSAGDVRFLQMPFAHVWVRDYGPLVVKSFGGGSEILDLDYASDCSDVNRRLDDNVPSSVAALGVPAISIPLRLDGGNILSNGAGLCLMTPRRRNDRPLLFPENAGAVVREYLGGQQLLVLEPLMDEPTGHLDMFCTFTAPDTVVVAECDPVTEPANARILNANAQHLAELRTNCGQLNVVRIPMPARREKDQWPTYTNVIYANGLLLVPSYPGVAADLEERALEVYRRLLPSWHIVRINAQPLVEKSGSLHCVAMNLGCIDSAAPAVAGK